MTLLIAPPFHCRRKIASTFLFVLVISLIPATFWRHVFISTFTSLSLTNFVNVMKASTVYHLMTQLSLMVKNSTSEIPNCVVSFDHKSPDILYTRFIREIVRIHRSPQIGRSLSYLSREAKPVIESERIEALNSLQAAARHQMSGRITKARKLLEHAFTLDPGNTDILVALGEVLEGVWRLEKQKSTQDIETTVTNDPAHTAAGILQQHALSVPETPITSLKEDELIVTAEHLYNRALTRDPNLHKATSNHRRLLPLVEEIDQRRFNVIDLKVQQFYRIPDNDPGLRHTKLEQYFRHIYHSNALEGNTLTLAQTRSILETRLAVGGKSLIEQNEVLGLDAALRFMNTSLIRSARNTFTLEDILELHRHLLGFVDLSEAGKLRRTQVYIADHIPPPAGSLYQLMTELVAWLNSVDAQDLHPIELAALIHWKFVYIHPFYDGNGRTARLLMNLILMRAGLPPAIIRLEDRHTYYEQLKVANDGDVRPFIRFITTCTERTIDEYISSAVSYRVDRTELPAPYALVPLLPNTYHDFIFVMNDSTNERSTQDHESSTLTRHVEADSDQMTTLPQVIYIGG